MRLSLTPRWAQHVCQRGSLPVRIGGALRQQHNYAGGLYRHGGRHSIICTAHAAFSADAAYAALRGSAIYGPLLSSLLEWDARLCLEARDQHAPTTSLREALLSTLGSYLMSTQGVEAEYASTAPGAGANASLAAASLLRPASVLRAALKGVCTASQLDELVSAIAANQRQECVERIERCRKDQICLTWKGRATHLSTLNTTRSLSVPVALALWRPEFDDICSLAK